MGKKSGKKTRIILVLLFVLLAVFALFFIIRRKNISQGVIREMENRALVCGVNETLPTHCVTENGILYGKNHSICFMELATKEEYVLCDEVNCTHLTAKCSAHYSDDMNGLALYLGNVYLFDLNNDGSAFEFIRMDAAGNQRKVLAKIDVGNFDVGEWYLISVSNAYYCGDYVWAELTYDYMEEDGSSRQQVQCIRISLDTGDITELTPLEDIGAKYEYDGIGEQQIMITKSWEEEKTPMTAHYACDPKEGKISLLEEYESIIIYNQDGTTQGAFSKYVVNGWYKDGFLFYEGNWELSKTESDAELWVWDIKNNVKEPVCTVKHGAAIMFGEGGIGDYIYDGENILFALYKENGMIDIAKVHLSTGEVTSLFEDTDNITFRIVGQTKDSFIGKVYDFDNESTTVKVYAVKKEDYFKGDFDHMELLQTIREKWY